MEHENMRKERLPKMGIVPDRYSNNILTKTKFTKKGVEMSRQLLSNRFKKIIYPRESRRYYITKGHLNISV